MNIVWSIAGFNSAGFSGIQTDFITLKKLNTHPCSIITAITAQHYTAIPAIHYLTPAQISDQLYVLHDTLPAKAIKIGMLGSISTIQVLKNYFDRFPHCIVLDPVIVSSSKVNLFEDDLTHYITALKTFLPHVTLITPNMEEAEILSGISISTFDDIECAAHQILALGVKNVLIKGGHFKESHFSQDFWTNGADSFWLATKRSPNKNMRGTGCMLASSMAAYLAEGHTMQDALVQAKMFIYEMIENNKKEIPTVSLKPLMADIAAFSRFDRPLGLYPIVDSIEWLEKLLPLGIQTIQLRIKNKTGDELENAIKYSISLAKQFNAYLFINDYWELAIKYGAYGVHLGQDDLTQENAEELRAAGLRLGISTHSHYEIARAHSFKPSYMAFGPIFETTTKVVPFAPQGLAKLEYWCRTLDYPMVAIGGIHAHNIQEVKNTGVDGIAMISAITKAEDPAAVVRKWITL